MLVYAIVLILVMLATNNPTLKERFCTVSKLGKKEEKGGSLICSANWFPSLRRSDPGA